MTLKQVYVVGLLGGFSAVLSLVLFAGLAVGVYCAVSRLADRYEDFRARRRDLKACREIARLGTTSHPIDQ
ncbi:hypothetical protein [Streptomyces mirabilis]|uniref:hypothetical protein n=1 Tax=Streptomyces mirabilis TaxID=68239 RepID=UPI0036B01C33